MVHQVKAPSIKPDSPSSVPGTHLVKGENLLWQTFTCLLWSMPAAQSCTYTHMKSNLIKKHTGKYRSSFKDYLYTQRHRYAKTQSVVALQENPGMIPAHTRQVTIICNSILSNLTPLLASKGTEHLVHRHKCRQHTPIHSHKNKILNITYMWKIEFLYITCRLGT